MWMVMDMLMEPAIVMMLPRTGRRRWQCIPFLPSDFSEAPTILADQVTVVLTMVEKKES